MCDVTHTNTAVFLSLPVRSSHSLALIWFPEVLDILLLVITAHAPNPLFSSFPFPSVSAAHHASLCPPNAPLSLPQSTLGRGWQAKTKGRSAGLALGILALSWKVKGSLSFMTVRRALCCWWTFRMWCWNAAQHKSSTTLLFSMAGFPIFLPDKTLFLKAWLDLLPWYKYYTVV